MSSQLFFPFVRSNQIVNWYEIYHQKSDNSDAVRFLIGLVRIRIIFGSDIFLFPESKIGSVTDIEIWCTEWKIHESIVRILTRTCVTFCIKVNVHVYAVKPKSKAYIKSTWKFSKFPWLNLDSSKALQKCNQLVYIMN